MVAQLKREERLSRSAARYLVPNCNILYDCYFAQEQVKLKFYLFCVLLKWCVWSAEVEIGAIFQT